MPGAIFSRAPDEASSKSEPMHVLITRPRPDADPFATRLHALGHTTIIEPLIEIVFRDGPPLDLQGVQALLFTSANGARAAARRSTRRNLQIVAVGPATAATARELGFGNVSESPGEGVAGLADHVRATLKRGNGALLHPAGSVSAGDLKTNLELHGFHVRKEELYEARAAEALSGALTAELGAGLVTGAMFFSPRTATTFATLIANAGLTPACRAIVAMALSEAVANALATLTFRQVGVAEKPTAEAMLDLIAKH